MYVGALTVFSERVGNKNKQQKVLAQAKSDVLDNVATRDVVKSILLRQS